MTEMTKELAPSADSYDPCDGLEDRRDHPFFADPDDVTAESYPHLRNVSPSFMFKRVVRALEPAPPEYVTLPLEYAGSVGVLARLLTSEDPDAANASKRARGDYLTWVGLRRPPSSPVAW